MGSELSFHVYVTLYILFICLSNLHYNNNNYYYYVEIADLILIDC